MLVEGLAMYRGPSHKGLCSRVLSVFRLQKAPQRMLGPARLSRKETELRTGIWKAAQEKLYSPKSREKTYWKSLQGP